MNEVKTPKRPLLFYYCIAMAMIVVFNMIAMPWLTEHSIRQVDYNTFVDMVETGQVGRA